MVFEKNHMLTKRFAIPPWISQGYHYNLSLSVQTWCDNTTLTLVWFFVNCETFIVNMSHPFQLYNVLDLRLHLRIETNSIALLFRAVSQFAMKSESSL